jgi:uncharacterized protein
VPKSVKSLLVASSEAYSGKSAVVLGMAHQLQGKGLKIAYGKPLGTCIDPKSAVDEDVAFVAETLKLSSSQVLSTFVPLDEVATLNRISGVDKTDYGRSLQQDYDNTDADLLLIESAGTLEEGRLFGLSALQLAHHLEAAVILVARYHSPLAVEALMIAKEQLGDRLIGVILNDISAEQIETVTQQIKPFLIAQGIDVLGLLPCNTILRSVSVSELVLRLKAEVLCCASRLDSMVESLKIGAMNVNSALEFFRRGRNMAVVTGGDRTDIQLAALETSTQCLILTGQLPPSPIILNRAEELEIPILSVDLDTLTTVEIIDRAFGQVRLHEPIKVQAICQMMAKHFDSDRLLDKLGIRAIATAS